MGPRKGLGYLADFFLQNNSNIDIFSSDHLFNDGPGPRKGLGYVAADFLKKQLKAWAYFFRFNDGPGPWKRLCYVVAGFFLKKTIQVLIFFSRYNTNADAHKHTHVYSILVSISERLS